MISSRSFFTRILAALAVLISVCYGGAHLASGQYSPAGGNTFGGMTGISGGAVANGPGNAVTTLYLGDANYLDGQLPNGFQQAQTMGGCAAGTTNSVTGLELNDAACVSGSLLTANGGLGNPNGLLPLVTDWSKIPGAVALWVCDTNLTLGDSGTVYQWTDSIGGYVATNAVNANQPTKVSNWLNGHCGVQFTNQSSTIQLSVNPASGFPFPGYPYEVIAIVEPTTAAPASAAYMVAIGGGIGYGMSQSSGALTGSCYDGTSVSQATIAMFINQAALVGCAFGGKNDGGQKAPETNFLQAGSYQEKSAVGSQTVPDAGITIGGLGGGGQGFGGMIGMVGVFNVTLNPQYLLQVRAMANSYYGMPF